MGHAGGGLDAQFAQVFGDQSGGFEFAVTQFRILVDGMAQLDGFRCEFVHIGGNRRLVDRHPTGQP